jgi:signal transduction histidine kinase
MNPNTAPSSPPTPAREGRASAAGARRAAPWWLWAAGVSLVVFVVWCLWLGLSAHVLRGQLESRVAWLVELSALRTLVDDHAGDATGGPGASLAEARRRVHALVAQTRREGVTRATVGALAALDQGLQASAPGLGPAEAAEREGRLLASFDAAVSALRAENRDISIELGEHWTHINALALAAVLMAGLILALLWVVWRRRDHERQLSAELLRSNADKDLFLAVLSHDIRTPMTAILGSAELLSGQPTPDRASRHAALVRNAGGTVVRLIDDVLALSRSQAGGLSLAAAPVDLRALLRESVALFQPAAEARGVELAWEVAEDVPAWVLGDVTRLRQIVTNLLANATKFTDAGTVRAALGVWESGGVELCVSDTGPGIAPDSLDRVFLPFNQGGADITARHGGSGLGLAIVRSLAQAMGGAVSVESQLGVGTTFRCRLPLPATERPPDRKGVSTPQP